MTRTIAAAFPSISEVNIFYFLPTLFTAICCTRPADLPRCPCCLIRKKTHSYITNAKKTAKYISIPVIDTEREKDSVMMCAIFVTCSHADIYSHAHMRMCSICVHRVVMQTYGKEDFLFLRCSRDI